MFNLNTQKHSKTGVTPFQLMFNRLANLREKGILIDQRKLIN